jgi:hypothetical protein
LPNAVIYNIYFVLCVLMTRAGASRSCAWRGHMWNSEATIKAAVK